MNAELYEKVWSHSEYRQHAPGESLAFRFLEVAKPYGRVIDFGCGTGRGALLIHAYGDVQVTAVDFAGNCLDPKVKLFPGVQFRQHDLRKPLDVETHEFGYCTDVLEHIAPGDVGAVLSNIFMSARRVFLCISTVPDHFGPALVDEPLHLTVQPHSWWRERLVEMGVRIDWEEEQPHAALFYGSIYANGDDYAKVTSINVSEDRLRENISRNLALDLPDVCPHEVQETKVTLLAGGPSLNDHEAEIVERGRAGELFVTVNGTYGWLLERGIKPAAQFMVDARPFNARFVDPVIDSCRYIFSSQTAHEAVAKVPKGQAWLFHSGDTPIVKECFDAYCKERGVNREWYPIYGGTTVVARALVCLAMLGFRNIEVIGWDSCLRGSEHHAYSQPENDDGHVVTIEVGGKVFRCHPWMVVQANEVPKLIRYLLGPIPDLQLSVRGDGIIAAMLNHAADLAAKKG